MLPADLPSAHPTGYGPRGTALRGELGGMPRPARRLGHDCCHAVLQIPLSLGAVHKVCDRVSPARVPDYEAIADLARHATVARSLRHPHRSQAACGTLREEWQGILGSAGYGG